MKLTLKDVEKQYFGHGTTLKNVSLEFDKKDGIIALYGAEGAGKTTLLKVIAGVEKPTAGEIFLDGKQITKIEKNFAMTFDDYAFNKKKSVKETLLYPMILRNASSTEQEEALARIDFIFHFPAAFYRAKIKSLSEREKTDVMLARIFMRQADVYLLDDPLSHLADKEREDYAYDLALLLRKLNGIVLISTDSPKEALILSDKLLVMSAGGICDFAAPREIYRRAQNIAAVNVFRPDANYFRVTVEEGRVIWENAEFLSRAHELIGRFYLAKEVIAGVFPENVALGVGNLEADVLQKVFRGDYTEYVISYEGRQIKAYAKEDYQRFEKVRFTVKFDTARYFDKNNSASVMKRS